MGEEQGNLRLRPRQDCDEPSADAGLPFDGQRPRASEGGGAGAEPPSTRQIESDHSRLTAVCFRAFSSAS